MGGLTIPTKKIKLAVLISGRGSNLQALIDATQSDDFPAVIAVVISNMTDAYGLVRAQAAGIPTQVISHKDYTTKSDFEKAIHDCVTAHQVDMICLAGFMRILSPVLIAPWRGRLINIHPSLLPKHKGLHTHERAIEAGDTESGCTVHYVTEGVDEGEIVIQKRVPILADDTPDTLAARVLEQEHIAYPQAIRMIVEGIIAV